MAESVHEREDLRRMARRRVEDDLADELVVVAGGRRRRAGGGVVPLHLEREEVVGTASERFRKNCAENCARNCAAAHHRRVGAVERVLEVGRVGRAVAARWPLVVVLALRARLPGERGSGIDAVELSVCASSGSGAVEFSGRMAVEFSGKIACCCCCAGRESAREARASIFWSRGGERDDLLKRD